MFVEENQIDLNCMTTPNARLEGSRSATSAVALNEVDDD